MPKCKVCGLQVKKSSDMIKVADRKYVCSQECNKVYLEQGETKTPREELLDYINELYDGKANFPMLSTQIKRLQDEWDFKLSGMLLALKYYIEIEGNSFDEEYNIKWIIEKYYPIAKEHWIKCREIEKNCENLKEVKPKIIKVKKSDNKIYFHAKGMDE